MLKLFTENTERSEPIIPLRWCVDRVALDLLEAYNVLEPLLFISIQNEKEGVFREVFRTLVPLKQMMEYVQLNHAGRHIIRAFIVWAEKGEEEREMYKRILSEYRRGDYERRIYQNDGILNEDFLHFIFKPGHCLNGVQAELEVHVGTEFFAPEPSASEKRWVNLWFGSEAFDQCEFRRRRFVAYTIQPIALLIWIPLNTIFRAVFAGISVFLGLRGIKFSPIWHPFRNSFEDLRPDYFWNDFGMEGNFFWTDESGKSRSRFFLLLYPPFLTVLAIALYFINQFNIWRQALIVITLATIFVLVVAVVVLAIRWVDRLLVDRKEHKRLKQAIEEVAKLEKPVLDPRTVALRQTYDELQYVACDGGTLSARVTALPKPRQTIHLRFQALKARVCRPYPRG